MRTKCDWVVIQIVFSIAVKLMFFQLHLSWYWREIFPSGKYTSEVCNSVRFLGVQMMSKVQWYLLVYTIRVCITPQQICAKLPASNYTATLFMEIIKFFYKLFVWVILWNRNEMTNIYLGFANCHEWNHIFSLLFIKDSRYWSSDEKVAEVFVNSRLVIKHSITMDRGMFSGEGQGRLNQRKVDNFM